MKKNGFSLLLAGVITAGTLLAASCSRDDVSAEEPVAAADYMQKLTVAADQLNQKLALVDLKDLELLASALDDECNCNDCQEGNPCESKVFGDSLKDLVSELKSSFNQESSFLRPSAFYDIAHLLALGWTIGGTNDYEFEYGGGIYKVTVSSAVVDGVLTRNLNVQKDGETVLDILSARAVESGLLPFMPGRSIDYTGTVSYSGINLILGYGRDDIHSRDMSLTIQQAEEDEPLVVMSSALIDNLSLVNLLKRDVVLASDYYVSILGGTIIIGGHVNSVGDFLSQSASLLDYYKNGTDERSCATAATKFNENVNINMTIAGTTVGSVFLMPAFNAELDNYVIALMVDSSLFGEELLDISSVLSNFGFSIEDIMDIINSKLRGENDDETI